MDATTLAEVAQLESWRSIPGYEGLYEASDQGRVRSLSREVTCSNGRVLRVQGRVLRPIDRGDGYYVVGLSSAGVVVQKRVSVLVLETFVGARPRGHHACHNNGDSRDNLLTNLRFDTVSENNYDLVRHGRHHNAIKTRCRNGHEFTPENTIRPKSNPARRHCRQCGRDANRRSSAKKRRAEGRPIRSRKATI